MYREIALALTVSIDTMLAAAACRTAGIRIPLLPAAVINLISSAVLGAAVLLSALLGQLLPLSLCRIAGAVVLIAAGAVIITKSLLRSVVKRLGSRERQLRLGELSIAVRLCLDDTAADMDSSESLSVPEAAALAIAGSLDSAAAGIGCGNSVAPALAALCCFVTGCIAVAVGCAAGKRLSSLPFDISWAGGVLLIILSAVNLFQPGG
ncbi:MAG: sporulation protein [Ruminococcus sp.]|nr:sporulation protein [Ruminococcus sp.]